MSMQWIVDNAESLRFTCRPVVGQTITRAGAVRSINNGNNNWVFEVKLADGIPWTTARPYLSAAEALDRYTSFTIQLNDALHATYMSKYQGDAAALTGFTANIVNGTSDILLTATPTLSSGYAFRAGDLIQLGNTGKTYQVAADVPYTETTVTLNRPVLDSSGSVSLNVGPNAQFTLICTQFPNWGLGALNQTVFSGPFIFNEVI